MSLQLETKEIEYNGEVYTLTANMEALEAIQEEFGSLSAVYNSIPGVIADGFFRAMLNAARAERGEPPVDKKTIHREYSYAMLHELDMVGMLNRAMFPETALKSENKNDDPGN